MIKAPDEQYHRYSKRPFPPYRFISGENPHPTEDPKGHSYRDCTEDPGIINPDKWYENETYQYGVDLYNYAFWWESHEVFESLWKKFPKDGLTGNFLQGLIKISAAFLKWHLKQQRGCEILYTGGIGHLHKVLDSSPEYMGLNLMDHIAKVSIHFREVIAEPNQWPDSQIDYPFIVLKEAE
jgi:hypothetical protein